MIWINSSKNSINVYFNIKSFSKMAQIILIKKTIKIMGFWSTRKPYRVNIEKIRFYKILIIFSKCLVVC